MGNFVSTMREKGGCFGDCTKSRKDEHMEESELTKEETMPKMTKEQKNELLKKRLGIKEKKGPRYRNSIKMKQNFYKEKLSQIDTEQKSLFESICSSRISTGNRRNNLIKSRLNLIVSSKT
jgi:hypothetical protein